MPTRNLLSLVLAIVLLPASARAAKITVWEHDGFRGASVSFDREVPRLNGVGWNDRVSSLRVDSGRWQICRDDDFSDCRTLSAGMGDMSRLDSGWNDALSSLRPIGDPSDHSAEQVAQRLYRAILGRTADPDGLRNATAMIERGQTDSFVRGMIQSTEYRNLKAQRSAEQLLDQIYQGLHGRQADAAAKRSYTIPLDRGEDERVILAILVSDDDAPPQGGGIGRPMPSNEQDFNLRADGAGFVVWGINGRYESLSGATVVLGRDGRARIDLAGTTPQTMNGSWTRESNDLMRLQIPDVAGRRADARGIVTIGSDRRLGRVELTAGTPGAHNQIVFTFVADGYTPPREETLCIQAARARLEDDRGAPLVTLFLAPERSSGGNGRDTLSGDALTLANPASFSYRCEVDSRRGQVSSANIQRR